MAIGLSWLLSEANYDTAFVPARSDECRQLGREPNLGETMTVVIGENTPRYEYSELVERSTCEGRTRGQFIASTVAPHVHDPPSEFVGSAVSERE